MVRARNLWNCFVRSSLARYLHNTKEAGTHLHLMQIRSRCFRSAHSGLRSRTVFGLSLSLSFSLPLSFFLSFSLTQTLFSPSLPPARISRAGSFSWKIETLPDVTTHLLRDQTSWKFCQHSRRVEKYWYLSRRKLTSHQESITFLMEK